MLRKKSRRKKKHKNKDNLCLESQTNNDKDHTYSQEKDDLHTYPLVRKRKEGINRSPLVFRSCLIQEEKKETSN